MPLRHVIYSSFYISVLIIISKVLSILYTYNIIYLDAYLTIVAASFMVAGYLKTREYSTQLVKAANQNHSNLECMFKELTFREQKVFNLLAQGSTNKEIASMLGVEVSTIKTHINHLYTKIYCKNRNEARNRWNEMKEIHINL